MNKKVSDYIIYWCPSCGTQLKISKDYAGKQGKCKYCEQKITVPDDRGTHEKKLLKTKIKEKHIIIATIGFLFCSVLFVTTSVSDRELYYKFQYEIKRQLLDSDSFKVVDAVAKKSKDTDNKFFMILFKSKNCFGGYVGGVALGEYSRSGTLLNIEIMNVETFIDLEKLKGNRFWWKKYLQ